MLEIRGKKSPIIHFKHINIMKKGIIIGAAIGLGAGTLLGLGINLRPVFLSAQRQYENGYTRGVEVISAKNELQQKCHDDSIVVATKEADVALFRPKPIPKTTTYGGTLAK